MQKYCLRNRISLFNKCQLAVHSNKYQCSKLKENLKWSKIVEESKKKKNEKITKNARVDKKLFQTNIVLVRQFWVLLS